VATAMSSAPTQPPTTRILPRPAREISRRRTFRRQLTHRQPVNNQRCARQPAPRGPRTHVAARYDGFTERLARILMTGDTAQRSATQAVTGWR
jgi:hypothetical protein